MSHEQYDAIYERGIAVGESDIKTDAITFQYRDETFTFPTWKVYPYVIWTGYFYQAKVEKLRELEREEAAAH